MRNRNDHLYVSLSIGCLFIMLMFMWMTLTVAIRKTRLMENQVIAQRLVLHNVTTELDTLKLEVRHSRALASAQQPAQQARLQRAPQRPAGASDDAAAGTHGTLRGGHESDACPMPALTYDYEDA